MPPEDKVQGDYRLIQDDVALAAACRELASSDYLAIDTEFVGERSYFPRLELFQITGGGLTYLIDVRALRNEQPLCDLLAGSALKILHAGGQDLKIVNLRYGFVPEPVFDTQVAAALLGYGHQVGLTALVLSVIEKTAVSGQTVSDWSTRPLDEDQLAYAASDVEHLRQLQVRLEEKLVKRGRLEWFAEEQATRLSSIQSPAAADRDLFWRVKGSNSLGREDLAVLRELTAWRETEARRRDVPRNHVVRDDALLDLARIKPLDSTEASRSRRINPRFYDGNRQELTGAIERAKALPPDQWPQRTENDHPDLPAGLAELLKAVLRSSAQRHDISPAMIANSADLQDLLVHRADLSQCGIPLLKGWRHEIAGCDLVRLLEGKSAVRVGPDGGLSCDEAG